MLFYPSSENKGADQLRSYCEADLRLCFRIGNNPVFSRCSSYQTAVALIIVNIKASRLKGQNDPGRSDLWRNDLGRNE